MNRNETIRSSSAKLYFPLTEYSRFSCSIKQHPLYSSKLNPRQRRTESMDFLLPLSDDDGAADDSTQNELDAADDDEGKEEAEDELDAAGDETKEEAEHNDEQGERDWYRTSKKRLIATTIKEIRHDFEAFSQHYITVEICGAFTLFMSDDEYSVAFLDEQGLSITLHVPLDINCQLFKPNQMVTIYGKVKTVKLGQMWKRKSWIDVKHIKAIRDFNELALHYLTAIYRKVYEECENDTIFT